MTVERERSRHSLSRLVVRFVIHAGLQDKNGPLDPGV